MCSEQALLSHFKRLQLNGDIWFITERDGSQECSHGNSRCHSASFVMYISGDKFEEHCFDISGDILDLTVFYSFNGAIYDIITFLICIIQKCEYL